MPDQDPTEPSASADEQPASADEQPASTGPPRAAQGTPARMPDYKGEPLDAGRGPGLGCFWSQVVVLAVLLVLTPLSVAIGAQPWVSAALLIVVLVLLLFVGQTAIFLLRLVAADRRTRRRPLRSDARKTVGMLEEDERSEAEERED